MAQITQRGVPGKTIKVYLVRVIRSYRLGIWYASKVGQLFYCAMAAKEFDSSIRPCFRLVTITDADIKVDESRRDIDPADCVIVEEKEMFVSPHLDWGLYVEPRKR